MITKLARKTSWADMRKTRAPLGASVLFAATLCLGAGTSKPFFREYVVPAGHLAEGAAARVIVTERAEAFDKPVTWAVSVTVGSTLVFRSETDDAWMDPNFHDPGFMAGWACNSYASCKRALYESVPKSIVTTVDATKPAWSFLLDPEADNRAGPTIRSSLRSTGKVDDRAVERLASNLERRLAAGPVEVLSLSTNPNTDAPIMMFVRELGCFVTIWSP